MNSKLLAGIACIALAGPAAPTAGAVLSATGAVIAIMGGELFLGEDLLVIVDLRS